MLPIVASVAGYELTDAEKYWLAKNQPAGISFFELLFIFNVIIKKTDTGRLIFSKPVFFGIGQLISGNGSNNR